MLSNVVVMVSTGNQKSQDEHKGRLILRQGKKDTGLEHSLHIRKVGPGGKGLTYQAWDSLSTYHNYFVSFIKLFPVSAVTVTPRETEAQSNLPHPEYYTTVLASHPDILLSSDP